MKYKVMDLYYKINQWQFSHCAILYGDLSDYISNLTYVMGKP